jgi:uncharacterized protein YuzE
MGEKMKGVFLNYDNENDVLYFHFNKAQKAVSMEIADGVFVRLDPKTDQVVGFTILDLSKKSLEARGLHSIPTEGNAIRASA